MPIEITERFRAAYLDLTPTLQRKVEKALLLLDANPRHPSLQTKPIRGSSGVFEARVDQRYRMTYERRHDLLIMRNVGPHDATLKNP